MKPKISRRRPCFLFSVFTPEFAGKNRDPHHKIPSRSARLCACPPPLPERELSPERRQTSRTPRGKVWDFSSPSPPSWPRFSCSGPVGKPDFWLSTKKSRKIFNYSRQVSAFDVLWSVASLRMLLYMYINTFVTLYVYTVYTTYIRGMTNF